VSGQLARAWGNTNFGEVAPHEEVCLAAEQHDIGMASWDAAPELNPDTGLPQSFLEMGVGRHLELWSRAPLLALSQSRYAALLVSLHGTTLYAMRDLEREPPDVAAAIREYMAAQARFQDELLTTLRDDPRYAEHAAPAAVDRNRRLVGAWDAISLALCTAGFPWTLRDVPTASDERVEVTVTDAGEIAVIDPWPFASRGLTVRCDGRRLEGRFEDEAEMRRALDRAPWTTLEFELVAPASG
jgi:hypothetical protein